MGLIAVVNKHKHTPTDRDFYIGRGSSLGNIYSHLPNSKALHQVERRDQAVDKFEVYLNNEIEKGNKKIIEALNAIYLLSKGGTVNLVCYCHPQRCHGDIIKKTIETKLKLIRK